MLAVGLLLVVTPAAAYSVKNLTHASVGACAVDTDCAGTGTDPHCVIQAGGYYSQCVDCEPTAFQGACSYWSPAILEPAQKICGLTCGEAPPPPPPPKGACASDAECTDAALPICVIQTDGAYSQCISCNAAYFQDACRYWDADKFLPAAEAKCSTTCTGTGPSPSLDCHTDADCTSPGLPTCVVQSDGQYAQCITCEPTQFHLSCTYWEPTKFLPAAEAKCGLTC